MSHGRQISTSAPSIKFDFLRRFDLKPGQMSGPRGYVILNEVKNLAVFVGQYPQGVTIFLIDRGKSIKEGQMWTSAAN